MHRHFAVLIKTALNISQSIFAQTCIKLFLAHREEVISRRLIMITKYLKIFPINMEKLETNDNDSPPLR